MLQPLATPAQIALAWLLHRSEVMLPIPRTVSVEHLEENVAAAGIQLSTDEVRALEDIAVFVPGEFRELLTGSPHRAEPFGVAEFVHRVADRGGTCGSSRVAVIS